MVFSTSYRTVAGLLLAGFLAACGGEQPAEPAPPAPNPTVEVTPGTATLTSGGATQQFSAVFKDAQGNTVSGKTFTWTSSSTAIATVDAAGLATVVSGDGTTTITATADGVSGTAVLTVSLTVASIEVTPATGELTSLGLTLQFTATANDAGGNPISGKIFTWTSSDPAVATIDASGLATSAGIGTTTITASGGGAQGVATLTVSQAGTGTGTLHVVADVTAIDLGAGLFNTLFSATVTDGAMPPAPVSLATVTITHATLGVVTLTEAVAGTGVYSAASAGFPGGEFELDIVSGTDNVQDVVVRGPGVHAITEPLKDAIVPGNQPLTVRWTVPIQAKGAELETRDFATGNLVPPLILPDTGAYVIPGVSNPFNDNQRIRLFRFNEVDIAGAIAGSTFQIKIRAEVEPVLVQASLSFSGDATFQGPHTGDAIYVAVVRASDGAVLATQNGTVSGTMDPSFSFSFPGVFVIGVAYEVHYWIDSNFGGGTVGVCDPKAIDHQWNVAVAAVMGDVSITELHDGAATTDVCASFP